MDSVVERVDLQMQGEEFSTDSMVKKLIRFDSTDFSLIKLSYSI